jgi:putative ergosteryl-3beta-O-L-aspartate hydrolase
LGVSQPLPSHAPWVCSLDIDTSVATDLPKMPRTPSPSALSITSPGEEIQMRETKPPSDSSPDTIVVNTEAHDFASPKSPTITFTTPDFEDDRHRHHRHNHNAPDRHELELPEHPLTEVFSNTFSDEEQESQFSMRPRSMSHHLSAQDVPSREWLTVKAKWWRALEMLGMTFHSWAWPRPAQPAFKWGIGTDSTPIELYFYLPPIYNEVLQHDPTHRFPCVINFHGGGFCLGEATDDKYWARVVLQQTNCIFVSVNYRRAPEHPFPGPVDDCCEAIMFIGEHAEELHIDQTNLALSGFSAGGNLAFTSALRLAHHYKVNALAKTKSRPMTAQSNATTETHETYGSHMLDADDHRDSHDFLRPTHSGSAMSTTDLLRQKSLGSLQIRSIVAWYPLLDWTMSRSRKIRESRNPEKCLSKTFTDLFDFSYLPAPDMHGDHCSPYASPALAPDSMLQSGLPRDIQLWLCEWDMLLREGQLFADRLDTIGKRVDMKMIPQVPHAWDKSPNPFRDQRAIDVLYTKAAMNLHRVFQDRDGVGPFSSMSSLHPNDPIIQRQPRRSVVLPM